MLQFTEVAGWPVSPFDELTIEEQKVAVAFGYQSIFGTGQTLSEATHLIVDSSTNLEEETKVQLLQAIGTLVNTYALHIAHTIPEVNQSPDIKKLVEAASAASRHMSFSHCERYTYQFSKPCEVYSELQSALEPFTGGN